MEMCVDHQLHLVSIWLPNDEKDVAILEPVYRQYKGTKYRVAVFRSGREDLLNNTAKLLIVQKEKTLVYRKRILYGLNAQKRQDIGYGIQD